MYYLHDDSWGSNAKDVGNSSGFWFSSPSVARWPVDNLRNRLSIIMFYENAIFFEGGYRAEMAHTFLTIMTELIPNMPKEVLRIV